MTNEVREINIQWSTTLSEEVILRASEGSLVSQLKKPITNDGSSRHEWARQATSNVPPRLLIGDELLVYQENFEEVLRQRIHAKFPQVPATAVEFLIDNGAQGGFGWYGLNYLGRVAQEKFGVQFELTREQSIAEDDLSYEITATDHQLFLTVIIKNINAFCYFDDVTQQYQFSEGASITSKTTFKIDVDAEVQMGYQCVSHQDTLLNHEWALHKSRATLLASMPIPAKNPGLTRVAKLKYDFLKHMSDYIAQHQPEIDSGFKTNIQRIFHELKKLSPDITRVLAIKNLNKALQGPNIFVRLFRWIASKFTRTPGNIAVVPVSRTRTISRVANALFRKRVNSPEVTVAFKPKFSDRVKKVGNNLVNAAKKIRFRGKKAINPEKPKASHTVISSH